MSSSYGARATPRLRGNPLLRDHARILASRQIGELLTIQSGVGSKPRLRHVYTVFTGTPNSSAISVAPTGLTGLVATQLLRMWVEPTLPVGFQPTTSGVAIQCSMR